VRRVAAIIAWIAVLLLVPGGPGARREAASLQAAQDQERGERQAAPEGQRRLVSEEAGARTLEIAAGPGSVLGKDELILKEYVDIKYGDVRLQADFVRYVPSTKEAVASGNVVLDHGSARITAESLTYNLETDTGTFYKARGYAEPSTYFEAERIEKISGNELVLHDATFTACTQPIPYWSFKVSRGLLRLDDYAYLRNLRFKIGRVPIFFTPYLVWPIKSDRASGLLFPEFGFSQRGGTVVSNAFYWAMRQNMDATVYLDYLSVAGYGTGLEYRYVPNDTGRGSLVGYYIRDQVAKEERRAGDDVPLDRWVINYAHNQDLLSGWRLVTNANFLSDFDYYLDFERDLRLSTNPQALSNFFLTRNWGFYSLNLRGERREQLINVQVPPGIGGPFSITREETIVRWIQPEIELRGRRQRLGNSPFFLTLESSANNFRTGEERGDYQRLDAFPVFSSQLSAVPWLDVDASVGYRSTYYTKSQRDDVGWDGLPGTGDCGEGNNVSDAEPDRTPIGVFGPEDDLGCDGLPGTLDQGEGNGIRDQERLIVVDESLERRAFQAGLTLIGPKFSRVFDRPDSDFSPQFRHTIEPQIRYAYRSAASDPGVPFRFDEIDVGGGDFNTVTYALVTRLFAKRPAGGTGGFESPGSQPVTEPGASVVNPLSDLQRRAARPPEHQEADAQGTPAGEEKAAGGRPRLSTVEVASLEISQDYSFLGPLSLSTNDSTRVSPVRAAVRFNPSQHTSLDLRARYDVLFRQIRDASLSANLRSPRHGFLDVTWSMVRDLEGFGAFDRNQIGFLGETSLLGRRLLLGMQANYELGDLLGGGPRLRDQRYKFGYNTQCCGFQLEVLDRNFLGSSQLEYRFLINLRGVGNVIDLQSGTGAGLPGTFPGTFQ
jgi:hypothetical protein